MIFDLYKLYSKKSLNKNRSFQYACVISVILAVGIIFTMQIILNVYEMRTSDALKTMNGTNVKILDNGYLEHFFDQNQLECLEQLGKSDCTLAYCNNTNLVSEQKDDQASLIVLSNNDITQTFGIDSLNYGETAISQSVAKRLNIRIGDTVYIKLHSDIYTDSDFKVIQILDDDVSFSVAGSEYEIAQEMLGRIYLILPEFDQYNVAYININDKDTIGKLKSIFSPDFTVRTFDELNDLVMPRIQLQMNILKLIASLAMIISSICLIWSFLIFITDRKDDFLIFKQIGLQAKDLSWLIVYEIFNIVIKGIYIGIPLGGVVTMVYMQKHGGIQMLSLLCVNKSIATTVLLVLIESMIFSIIPVLEIKNNLDENQMQEDDLNQSIGVILIIITLMIIISCIYVKSFIGVLFFIVIGIIFALFYLALNLLTRIIIRVLSLGQKSDFLFIKDMKEKRKIIIFSLNIINVSVVVLLILADVVPMLYSPIEEGMNAKRQDTIYQTVPKTSAEEVLIENNVKYYKYYFNTIEIIQINGKDVAQCVNSNIAQEYKEESIQQIRDRTINIYADSHIPDEWKNEKGIYINNVYKNIIDFKEGDVLTLSCNNVTFKCEVAGVYEDLNDKDTLGIVEYSYMKQQGFIQSSGDVLVYTLVDNLKNDVITQILFRDKNAYIDKNQELYDYLKQFIDNQKEIMIGNIIAVGFSSVLLVLLGQIILFVKKRDYYKLLWKIGMGKNYLINSMVKEKSLLSVMQVFAICIFLEPIRFFINFEMLNEGYKLKFSLILSEYIIVWCINLFSIVIPVLIYSRKKSV